MSPQSRTRKSSPNQLNAPTDQLTTSYTMGVSRGGQIAPALRRSRLRLSAGPCVLWTRRYLSGAGLHYHNTPGECLVTRHVKTCEDLYRYFTQILAEFRLLSHTHCSLLAFPVRWKSSWLSPSVGNPLGFPRPEQSSWKSSWLSPSVGNPLGFPRQLEILLAFSVHWKSSWPSRFKSSHCRIDPPYSDSRRQQSDTEPQRGLPGPVKGGGRT